MRTIYIDSEYICHADFAEGRTTVQTDALDSVCDVALECYKFIPAHDGKVDLIQCIDNEMASMVQRGYEQGENSRDDEVAELLDTIEDLCNELIGE